MLELTDSPLLRKERGAFFTPPDLARFIAEWAIRRPSDRVLEPSCGDAVFLAAAAETRPAGQPFAGELVGYDLHADSVADGLKTLASAGVVADLRVADFFDVEPDPSYSAVVGNPPYIRFQGFGGASRAASLRRAAAADVSISGLASSWAAFVVHSSTFLEPGGRMGLVLPAELLSVNYAAAIRRYLLASFASIELVLFEELVFAGVQADVVVLLADGYRQEPSDHFALFQTKNVATIASRSGFRWRPTAPSAKWTEALVAHEAATALRDGRHSGLLAPLSSWGSTTSGMVTGANNFFCISPAEAVARGLSSADLVRILPSGLSLGRLSSMTESTWKSAGSSHKTLLFRPHSPLSREAQAYIEIGVSRAIEQRYKCKVRAPWWRVPMNRAPDLFVSYMSGLAPRVVANRARLHNLNSIHGLYVDPSRRAVAQKVLPLMGLSSHSLMSAELVGRTYGGGILKMEPREAGEWLVVSEQTARCIVKSHSGLLALGNLLLRQGDQAGATAVADSILVAVASATTAPIGDMSVLRESRLASVQKRLTRGSTKAPAV